MASKKSRKKSSKRSRRGGPRKARGFTIGGKAFECYAKKVRTGRGRKRTTRAFCRKPQK